MTSANVHSTSKVIFMCGPAGSGKSTVAKMLETQGLTRLSFDEESFKRGIVAHPMPEATHAEIERDLLQRLLLLMKGKSRSFQALSRATTMVLHLRREGTIIQVLFALNETYY